MSGVMHRRGAAYRLAVVLPALWLTLLFAVPFFIVLKISLSETAAAQPPYTPVFDVSAGWQGVRDFVSALSFGNYVTLLSDSLYVSSYVRSLQIAAVSTLILLIIGYPLAYSMTRAPRGVQPFLVMLVVLPFLTAYLIRIYAWMNLLQPEGLVNAVLMAVGAIAEPLTWLPSDQAIYLGIVYSYLPFMVLPLYASLERIDETLREAAADLGCPRWKAFWIVTVPLSARGVVAGGLLCFIPILGEFVVPDLLGGSESLMIGQTLWIEFFANRDWPVAAAVAVTMLCVLLLPILLYQRLQQRQFERGG
jgi:putrescine transport system permease protein